MRTLALLFVLLMAVPAGADRESYYAELAKRRAARAYRSSLKYQARLARSSSARAHARLMQLANAQVDSRLAYQGPHCSASRASQLAAQRAYYRGQKLRMDLPQQSANQLAAR